MSYYDPQSEMRHNASQTRKLNGRNADRVRITPGALSNHMGGKSPYSGTAAPAPTAPLYEQTPSYLAKPNPGVTGQSRDPYAATREMVRNHPTTVGPGDARYTPEMQEDLAAQQAAARERYNSPAALNAPDNASRMQNMQRQTESLKQQNDMTASVLSGDTRRYPNQGHPSPYGQQDAQHFQNMSDSAASRQAAADAEWATKTDASRAAYNQFSQGMANQGVEDPTKTRDDAKRLATQFNTYRRGGGELSYTDYLKELQYNRKLDTNTARFLSRYYDIGPTRSDERAPLQDSRPTQRHDLEGPAEAYRQERRAAADRGVKYGMTPAQEEGLRHRQAMAREQADISQRVAGAVGRGVNHGDASRHYMQQAERDRDLENRRDFIAQESQNARQGDLDIARVEYGQPDASGSGNSDFNDWYNATMSEMASAGMSQNARRAAMGDLIADRAGDVPQVYRDLYSQNGRSPTAKAAERIPDGASPGDAVSAVEATFREDKNGNVAEFIASTRDIAGLDLSQPATAETEYRRILESMQTQEDEAIAEMPWIPDGSDEYERAPSDVSAEVRRRIRNDNAMTLKAIEATLGADELQRLQREYKPSHSARRTANPARAIATAGASMMLGGIKPEDGWENFTPFTKRPKNYYDNLGK